MGKVYQFPVNKRINTYKAPNKYSPDRSMICDLIETLILTYEERIKELETYKEEIKQVDGLGLKNPKAVLKQVKVLQKLFLKYGISCNFFKFYTKDNLEVRYYNESDSVYVIQEGDVSTAKRLSVGEFIQYFEGYPFSVAIEEAILDIFNQQINQLSITIKTIKNTEI